MPFVVALTLNQYFDLMMVFGIVVGLVIIGPWLLAGTAVILWLVWLVNYPEWCLPLTGLVVGVWWLYLWSEKREAARLEGIRSYRAEREAIRTTETNQGINIPIDPESDVSQDQRSRIAQAFGRPLS
jgi:hypothetical protein